MDKQAKGKCKKTPTKSKNTRAKKRKSDGQTCTTFLHDLTRKFALKRRQQEEESPKNVVQTIVSSITNALPIKISKKAPPKKEPLELSEPETLSDELQLAAALEILHQPEQLVKPEVKTEVIEMPITEKEISTNIKSRVFKIPRMPLVSSEIFKKNLEKRKVATEDASVNTTNDRDVASELARHVGTLRKISLIAEEFNQKTAKNLKEIVDSVQEDLLQKLKEAQAQKHEALSVEPQQGITEKQ